MFALAESFNEPIRHWKTGKVTDMSSMFQQSYVFDQDISDWDTSYTYLKKFDKDISIGKSSSLICSMHQHSIKILMIGTLVM